MSEDHYKMILAAIRDELEHNKGIIEQELATGLHSGRRLSTTAWERYRSQLKPKPSLRDRFTCLRRGHDDYVCEATCCRSRTAWCVVCGRDTPAGRKSTVLAPSPSPPT